jgi:hypothetical protein
VTKDVSVFDSAAVTVPDRPTATFTIGGREYKMRCPKLRVWMAVIERQEDYDAGQALKPHIQELYTQLAKRPIGEERDKLIEQYKTIQPVYSQAPTALQLATFLLDFLANCMIEADDRQALSEAYHTDDGPVDIPDLRRALDEMDEVFADWLDAQSDFVGVQRPELPERPEPVANRADRRASGRTSAAKKPAGSKRTVATAG